MCPGVAGLLGHGLLGGWPESQAAVHTDLRLLGAFAASLTLPLTLTPYPNPGPSP